MGAVVVASSDAGKYRVARRLLAMGATSPWSAQKFETKNGRERSGLDAAVASGVVVKTEAGTYFVDPVRYEALQTQQRWAIIISVAVVLLLMAILYVTGEFSE